jgi:1-aminocyclopropane-1-carboxylate deaminase/D-cysteine desulfhydrase-like pyridoxal-dependent ACC family enzyme
MIARQFISRNKLRKSIAELRRVALAHKLTPLEECPRLSEALGGPRILIKRDDCTGLAFGGNKARQLEFTLGEAMARGADLIVHGAASQSNHCRQTAAAAAKLGLKTVLVLTCHVKSAPVQGNLLLDYVLGAEVRLVETSGPALNEIKKDVGKEYRAQGHNPFVIAPPISATLGAVAYVDCLVEICDELNERGIRADYLVTCSSAATQSGLVLANKATGADQDQCIAPTRRPYSIAAAMADVANRAAERLGVDVTVGPEEVHNTDDYVGKAYGIVTGEGIEALRLVARTECIILDPSYTAKALAGLIHLTRIGQIESAATVVFLHTGGTPALFAYAEELF